MTLYRQRNLAHYTGAPLIYCHMADFAKTFGGHHLLSCSLTTIILILAPLLLSVINRHEAEMRILTCIDSESASVCQCD